MSNESQHHIDARNLNCPLPILKTKKALNAMSAGETLSIIATDPGSVKDFESFCDQTGNVLLSSDDQNGEYVFSIQKS